MTDQSNFLRDFFQPFLFSRFPFWLGRYLSGDVLVTVASPQFEISFSKLILTVVVFTRTFVCASRLSQFWLVTTVGSETPRLRPTCREETKIRAIYFS